MLQQGTYANTDKSVGYGTCLTVINLRYALRCAALAWKWSVCIAVVLGATVWRSPSANVSDLASANYLTNLP